MILLKLYTDHGSKNVLLKYLNICFRLKYFIQKVLGTGVYFATCDNF